MQAEELTISDAWLFTPIVRPDPRGSFLESFKASTFEEVTGRAFPVKQTNISQSRAGTVRGVHFAQVPPGQGKYVTCVSGSILDVVVDLRLGSPTFGMSESVVLDDESRKALFIAEGLGHALCAISGVATVNYLCTESYAPTREFGIHPLDPALGIAWPDEADIVLSDKDSAAPTLEQAGAEGLLPSYAQCREHYETMRIR